MKRFLTTALAIVIHLAAYCQFGTLNLTSEAYEGVTLFHPNGSTDTYLINNQGELVHTWPGTNNPGIAVYLLENGQLLRSGRVNDDYPFGGGRGGLLQLVEWDGTVSWEYTLSNAEEKFHHDYQYLPNGNILALVWEARTVEEAIEVGRDPSTLGDEGIWSEKVVELRPVGTNEVEVVWEWYVWDHLVQDFDDSKPNFGDPAINAGLIDINYDNDTVPDWLHANAMAYNAELDQIMLSIPEFDEVWVIDHSTTTEEAASSEGGNAGRGGDLLYRWGNPMAYRRGTIDDRRLYYQHSPKWLKQGDDWKIIVFNNGRTRPEGFISSVDIIATPWDGEFNYDLTSNEAYGPEQAEWTYTSETPTDLYSAFVSSAQVLPNGNILVCSGVQGDVFELNAQQERVWEYRVPVGGDGSIFCWNDTESAPGFNFRVEKLPIDYPGLGELTNEGRLEGNDCPVILGTPSPESQLNVSYYDRTLEIEFAQGLQSIQLIDLLGRPQIEVHTGIQERVRRTYVSTSSLKSGVYVLIVTSRTGEVWSKKYLFN